LEKIVMGNIYYPFSTASDGSEFQREFYLKILIQQELMEEAVVFKMGYLTQILLPLEQTIQQRA